MISLWLQVKKLVVIELGIIKELKFKMLDLSGKNQKALKGFKIWLQKILIWGTVKTDLIFLTCQFKIWDAIF